MGILDLNFSRNEFRNLEDYDRIINYILKLNIPFKILRFNLTDSGIDVKIDVPTEKIPEITKTLKKENIKIKKHVIRIDKDLCIDCGQCISLCNTKALYFDEEFELVFDENKCVGCHLCVNACPRNAIVV
ncbi:MAG: ATP-binding protein [Promethearchaeota archaeon]